MKKTIYSFRDSINLKNNKILKLYLLISFLLNLTYLFLKVYKDRLSKKLALTENLEPSEFMKVFRINDISVNIESIFIVITLICLFIFAIKKYDIKQFFAVNFTYLVLFSTISFIVSNIFEIHFTSLIEQFIVVFQITVIVFIFYIIKTIFKKVKLFL
ncbi:hypothetical protein [Dethiothermospora halolimnae]|uniref:hypothetical protein n=1 Tax=Dethiothermospora halolimnae TaxID=3114390 RepID=UPI003CCBBF74